MSPQFTSMNTPSKILSTKLVQSALSGSEIVHSKDRISYYAVNDDDETINGPGLAEKELAEYIAADYTKATGRKCRVIGLNIQFIATIAEESDWVQAFNSDDK